MEKTEIYAKVKELVTNYLRLGEDEIQPNSHVIDDLGADSLALIELGFQISETFNIPVIEPDEDRFVFQNLIDFIDETINAQ